LSRAITDYAVVVMFAVLTGLLFIRGILHAMSVTGTDFPNYLTAAKIVADGGEVERLYDNQWFQEQMRRYHIGIPEQGKFAPFPPPTALLLLPLTSLTQLDALRVMTVVSVLCLIASALLLMRILSWSFFRSSVFVLLSGYAVFNCLRLGQPYIVVSLSCILGYYAYLKGRPVLAGVCFGLFVPIKYFPVVMLVYFACRREWKVVLGGVLAIATIALVSIGILGWKIHEEYLASVLGNHLIGKLSMQDDFATSYQSLDALSRRLLVFDAAENPHPWAVLPRLQMIAVMIVKAALAFAAVATLIRLARKDFAGYIAPSLGILGVLALLIAPATATYHFVLLWLPVALLTGYLFREGARLRGYLVLGLVAIIGFVRYQYSQPFEERGALVVLAFPRLWLLMAIFVVCLSFVWSRGQPALERERS